MCRTHQQNYHTLIKSISSKEETEKTKPLSDTQQLNTPHPLPLPMETSHLTPKPSPYFYKQQQKQNPPNFTRTQHLFYQLPTRTQSPNELANCKCKRPFNLLQMHSLATRRNLRQILLSFPLLLRQYLPWRLPCRH